MADVWETLPPYNPQSSVKTDPALKERFAKARAESRESKGLWNHFIDTLTEGAFNSGLGFEPVYRTYRKGKYGQTDERINKDERRILEGVDKRRATRELDFQDVDTLSPANIGKWAVEIGGNLIGGVDPTYALNPGGGPLARVLSQAGINAGVDAFSQAQNVRRGVRDEYRPAQTAVAAVGGAGMQAGGELASKVRLDRMGIKLAKDLGGDFGTVTSTFRSPARNKKVGGAKNSYHLSGRAIDIARGKGVSHADIKKAYEDAGFNIVESLDEGDHSHFAFDFNKSAAPRPQEDQWESINDSTPIELGGPLDNVIDFPGAKRPELTPDELRDILADRGRQYEESGGFDDVLTPAERQDMDASVPSAPAARGAMSEDILDSVVGQGRVATTPVNENPQPFELPNIDDPLIRQALEQDQVPFITGDVETDTTIAKILKDILNNEEGTFRPDEFWKRFSNWRDRKAAYESTQSNPQGSAQPSGGGPQEPPSLFSRLTEALQGAGSRRTEQDASFKTQRAERARKLEEAGKTTSGRASLYAMKGSQKGELDKVEFDPIEDKFTPEEIDTMSDYIKDFNGWTSVYDAMNALDGWDKLLKGILPENNELVLLEKVLPRDAVTAILKNMPRDKAELIADALNIPRSVLSSFDISAPGRQGVFLIGRPEWRKGLGDMIRQFGSEEAHQRIQQAIRDDPDFKLSEIAGLATQDTQVRLGGKEENFASNLAEQYIPGIRASDRSFSGYLHKLRFDVFKSIIENHREAGVDVENPAYLKSLGTYLNTATGRGDLPKFMERWAPFLNATMFSPRLLASRFNLLLNPVFWAKMDPNVRAEALKDLSKFSGVATSILGLAAMNGADIELDPTSSDFLKIKFGDRRYDILGGFQQFMVLSARIAKYTAEKTGMKEKSKGFGHKNLQDAPLRFARTKLAPIPSAIIDSWLGKDVTGQDTNVLNEALGLFQPMSASDIAEAAYDDGLMEAVFASPSLGGVGYAKYSKNDNKKKTGNDVWETLPAYQGDNK